MTVAAETAVRAWINGRSDLVGTTASPGPLGHGAYLIGQTFPSGGAFFAVQVPCGEKRLHPCPAVCYDSRPVTFIR